MIALKKSKVTQQSLAKELNLGRGAVSDMLKKAGDPPLKYVEATAKLTGYSKEWLLNGDEQSNTVREARATYETTKDSLIKMMMDKLNNQEDRIKALEKAFKEDLERIAKERAAEWLKEHDKSNKPSTKDEK